MTWLLTLDPLPLALAVLFGFVVMLYCIWHDLTRGEKDPEKEE
ncbi:MAG: hypothetical protein Q8P12_05470 [bacterium]|nr:hypothetical protein [bacterium]MDZ4346783.1 hypothetical protein [Candidatus Binatia bacterium]